MSSDTASAFERTQPALSVVVPAYNEEARIAPSLARVIQYLQSRGESCEVLVVDDGSTDGTRAVVEQVAAGHPNVQLLHYDGNRGKGFAVRYGMVRATGDYILFSDADLSTPIEEVEKLLTSIRAGADIAIGSRDVKDSDLAKRQSRVREFGGKVFNRFVQLLAVPGIHDTQCGFKLFTRASAHNVFAHCQVDNFSFDVEALHVARLLGYSVAEIGVHWEHRDGSKVDMWRDSWRMVRTLFRVRATDYQIKTVSLNRRSLDR